MKTFIQAGPSQFVASHLEDMKIGSGILHRVPIALFTCLEKSPGWRGEREGGRWRGGIRSIDVNMFQVEGLYKVLGSRQTLQMGLIDVRTEGMCGPLLG